MQIVTFWLIIVCMYSLLPEVGLILHGKTRCPRNWFVDEISASFHRIYYVLSGTVKYRSRLEEFQLKHGGCYIFPVFTPYSINHDPEDPLSCVYLHINVPHLIRKQALCFPLVPESVLYYLMKSIEKLIESMAPITMITPVVQTMLRKLAGDKNLELKSDQRIAAVIDYIQQNIGKSLDNEVLARIAGLNQRYFIRFFRKRLGQTPQAYVSAVRFNKAAELLNAGSKVRDAAENVGFADSSSFYRFFTERAGCAPSRFQTASERIP